jgi:hypothetical protein
MVKGKFSVNFHSTGIASEYGIIKCVQLLFRFVRNVREEKRRRQKRRGEGREGEGR